MDVDSLPGFDVPPQFMESSFEDDVVSQFDNNDTQPEVVTYEIIEEGTQKGKNKLADSEGYTYTVKERRENGNKVWTCSVRNKSVWCKARVTEKPDGFSRGSIPHIHPPQLGAATAARISMAAKKMAASEVFVSAAEIVNKVAKVQRLSFLLYDYCSR